MRRSIDQILTTHAGSLPRHEKLRDAWSRPASGPKHESEFEALLRSSVGDAREEQSTRCQSMIRQSKVMYCSLPSLSGVATNRLRVGARRPDSVATIILTPARPRISKLGALERTFCESAWGLDADRRSLLISLFRWGACDQAVRRQCSLRENDSESAPTPNRSAESFRIYSGSTAASNFAIGSSTSVAMRKHLDLRLALPQPLI
jgi:hypothetical protein